ncbi:DUF4124 domain-containing protein [Stenotrophomonas mori]|uniref:DUF4124 domain-containing protein n=1 Tax=Stenotrophomonas mori TaxID=2871096 RepID=A0ABT0SDI0_9GAMM|nr:DUF4124 domain-containing protein [Stenotrophomonas mori]MCL7713373.1 DUF4124 domain-containing protein [Stenotrophomonas mori]
MPVTALSALLASLLLLSAGASAQEVYRCKGASGETAYSAHPCDAGSQPMKLREERLPTSAPVTVTAPPGPGEPESELPADSDDAPLPGDPPTEGDLPPALVEVDRSAERACIATATAAVYGPSNDRVASYQQQMAMLGEQLGQASDPTHSSALRGRMANLRESIAREHARAHQQISAARRHCVEQHRAPAP